MKTKLKNIAMIAIIITLLAPSFLATFSLAKEEIDSSTQASKKIEDLEFDEEKEEADNLEASKEDIKKEEEEKGQEQEFEKDKVQNEEQKQDDTLTEKIETEPQEENSMLMKSVPNTSKELPKGDGVYFISTALDYNKVLDIGGGSTANFANVQLWENTNVKQQKFEMRYNVKLKTYTIKATHSNKVLDVANAGTSNGTNVWQYESNGTEAQQWMLEEAGDDYFYIVSKCNGLYLDVNGGNTKNGTNIQVYQGNKTKAQKFKFTKVPELVSKELPEGDGVYSISTALERNKVLDVNGGSTANSANVQIWENGKTKQQKFEMIYNAKSKTYTIKATHSNKVLDVANAGTSNGTNVWQYESNGTEAQQWVLEEAGDGCFYIISKCNDLYLDVNGGNTKNGTNIQLYQGNRTKAQKFKFTKFPELVGTNLPEGDGIYTISTALNDKKVLDVSAATYHNGGNIQLWESTKGQQQRFELKYHEKTKTYTIMALHSGKVLDIAGGSIANGTNVWQYGSNGTEAQQWILQEAGDGYYYIISKGNELYLDVANGQSQNGTNIQTYQGNGSKAQKFKFTKDERDKTKKTIEDGIYQIHSKIKEDKILQLNTSSNQLQVVNKTDIINNYNTFHVKYLENGYYSIKVVQSEYNLTVENGKNINGTKIKSQKQDNSTIQEWIIKQAENDYFYIIGRCNGLYMDMTGGIAEVGTSLQMYQGNQTEAQKFKFERAKTTLEGKRVLENGVYYIQTALNHRKVLDVSGGSCNSYANVQLWENEGVQQQKFEVTYNEQGKYYQIISVNSGKALDALGNGKENRTNVHQYEKNNTIAQQWILQEAGNGYFYVFSKGTELYLDTNNASTNNGTNIQLYEGNGSTAQKFKFEKTTMIGEETYKIAIRNDGSKFFDIGGGSTAEGANLQIWQDSNVNQQVFRVKFDEDKTYCKITAKHSNKVLTVEPNNNVVQRTDTGADNQRWSIEIVGYRYYKIKSKANGLYLDVDCDGTANGTNIKAYTGYDTNAQKFYFSGVRTLDGIDVSEHQYGINWQQVRNAGIDFAIIRVGYGQHAHQKDKYFEENYLNATNVGMKVGTYLYSYAQSVEDARREAYNCLAWLRGRHLDYPVFYDIEDRTQGWIDPQTMTNMVNAFCEIISSAGYKTGVYTYRDWFRNKIYTNQLPGNYQIWLAHYTWDVNKPSDYEGYYNIWQYTSRGYVPGINGNVDRNIEYRNY